MADSDSPFASQRVNCRCGAATATIKNAKFITICHCTHCRKDGEGEPSKFLGGPEASADFDFSNGEWREGPLSGRRKCRSCGSLLAVMDGTGMVYINCQYLSNEPFHMNTLGKYSEMWKMEEEANVPYPAHVWCNSDKKFDEEYHCKHFDTPLPCYFGGLGPNRRMTDLNGGRMTATEIQILRKTGRTGEEMPEEENNKEWNVDELKKVFNAAKFGKLNELREYIEAGAPVDCTPYGSQTPAYIACFYGRLNALKYLTMKGADLNIVEKDGYTPAHAAASEGHVDCLRWLHENGGNVSAQTQSGQTCLSLARKGAEKASKLECIRFLESLLKYQPGWIKDADCTLPTIGENGVKKWSVCEMKKVFDAAKHNRLGELKTYVEAGAPVDCTPYGSQTPAYIACFYGRLECLEYLASKGADLNKTEKDGFTPAHAAASEGNVECLEKLHRLNADLHYSTQSGQTCLSLAHRADRKRCIRWLNANLEKSTRVWTKDQCKPVFDAAKHGRIQELQSYIESGAPVNCTPYGTQTPVYIACFYGKVKCLRYLASKGADLNCTEKEGFTPSHAAASEGHLNCLKELHLLGADLNKATKSGHTCISLGKVNNRTEVLEWLNEMLTVEGSDYDLYSDRVPYGTKEWTPEKCKNFWIAAKKGDKNVLNAFVTAGAPVNCTPFGSQTPLYIACYYGHLSCVAYLAAAGADLEKADSDGYTAAHAAASQGHLQCLMELQKLGADLTKTSKKGATCVSLATRMEQKEVVEWLEKSPTCLPSTNLPAKTAPPSYEEVMKDRDVKQPWSQGECKAVFNSAKHGNLRELMSYIEAGAPLECTPFGSQTPTYIAAFYGQVDCLQYLASKGSDLNRTEKDGFTAAHAAASEGHLKALRVLRNLGADLTIKTEKGQTCLTLAQNSGHHHIIQFLENPDAAFEESAASGTNSTQASTSQSAEEATRRSPSTSHDSRTQTSVHPIDILPEFNTALHSAAKRGDSEELRAILESGVDVNIFELGLSALHVAVRQGHIDCVDLLIGADADLNVSTEVAGFTPCLIASGIGSAEILERLKRAGADLDATTHSGSSIIMVADPMKQHEIKALLSGIG